VSLTYKKLSAVGADGWPGKYASDSVQLALYDLRTDPGETLDLKEKYPEVMKELMAIAERYRKELGDDITKSPCSECREPARVK
jgi:arylsulfatase